MSEIATRQETALAITPGQTEFNDKQVATLSQLGVVNADRANLAVFFHQAVRTGLDPFARQIYMIGRNSSEWDPVAREKVTKVKYTIQTGIDGYRLIARRAADQARAELSIEDTLWCGNDGQWLDAWVFPYPPTAAKVTVWRGNERFSAVALWNEYVQTYYNKNTSEHVPNSMWAKMPSNQLAKCAEAAALRKAFPLDLSGVYTDEEMPSPEQVDSEEKVDYKTVQRKLRTRKPDPKDSPENNVPAEPEPETRPETGPEPGPEPEVVDEAPSQDDAANAAFEQGLNAEPVEDLPASIAERKELGMHLQSVYASQEIAMQWVSDQLGRPVSKSAELTSNEVQVLIGELKS